jgi:hypothetical protein
MSTREPESSNGTSLLTSDQGEERAEIEAEIEAARARVAATMRTIGAEVARRGDWRVWVRTHPALVLAGVFGVGYTVGGGLSTPLTGRLLRWGLTLGLERIVSGHAEAQA